MTDQDNPYKWVLESSDIPTFYAQEETSASEPAIVHIKLFTPYHNWTWLLLEYDPKQELAFGFSYDSGNPMCAELGYISFDELRSVPTKVCRDILFEPMTLREAKEQWCPGILWGS